MAAESPFPQSRCVCVCEFVCVCVCVCVCLCACERERERERGGGMCIYHLSNYLYYVCIYAVCIRVQVCMQFMVQHADTHTHTSLHVVYYRSLLLTISCDDWNGTSYSQASRCRHITEKRVRCSCCVHEKTNACICRRSMTSMHTCAHTSIQRA